MASLPPSRIPIVDETTKKNTTIINRRNFIDRLM